MDLAAMVAEPAHRRAIEGDGWTLLPSIGGALDALLEIFARRWGDLSTAGTVEQFGYDSLVFSRNLAARRAAQEELDAVVAPYLAIHVPGARIAISNLLVKPPSAPITTVRLHQDYAIVDETAGPMPLQIWIPLVDVLGPEDGGIELIPGTQLAPNPYRAAGDSTPFARFLDRIRPRAVRVPLHAGEPVCFSPLTVHGSSPNFAPKQRPAFAALLAPREKGLVHYVRRSPSEVEMLSITDEALRAVLPDGPPSGGQPVKRITHGDPVLDEAGYAAWCRARDGA